jgi:hypothetical protein
MRLLYFLAIAAVVAAIWFRFRRRVKTKPQPTKQPKQAESDLDPKYQAISINLGENVCNAARALAGKHFTPQEAPRFPLEGCDQKHCDCSYLRESERREGGRRRADDGLEDIITTEIERRDEDRRD